jgi:hypothetical protein
MPTAAGVVAGAYTFQNIAPAWLGSVSPGCKTSGPQNGIKRLSSGCRANGLYVLPSQFRYENHPEDPEEIPLNEPPDPPVPLDTPEGPGPDPLPVPDELLQATT